MAAGDCDRAPRDQQRAAICAAAAGESEAGDRHGPSAHGEQTEGGGARPVYGEHISTWAKDLNVGADRRQRRRLREHQRTGEAAEVDDVVARERVGRGDGLTQRGGGGQVHRRVEQGIDRDGGSSPGCGHNERQRQNQLE